MAFWMKNALVWRARRRRVSALGKERPQFGSSFGHDQNPIVESSCDAPKPGAGDPCLVQWFEVAAVTSN
ncbi:MAG: hypothetical protein QOF73_2943 [Thermomicrobiales bacterium]|jgi:hypothetical protein|nr:hypothetical protein [Thermomicrobiales bacterium]